MGGGIMGLMSRIGGSRFVREAFTLLGGNVVAQAVSLIAYLVLTRIYSPSDFALFTIFYSYIDVLVILSTCKYELAVVAADTDAESKAVARLSLRLNACISFLLLTVVALLYILGAFPDKFAQLGWVVLLIPPMVFFCGTSRVYTEMLNRARRYRAIAANATANATAMALLKAILGLMGFHRSGMPLGTVLGQAISNLQLRMSLRPAGMPTSTAVECRQAARKHRRIPLFTMPKDLVNAFSSNLPFLWVALYCDPTELGLFALALTAISRPIGILNNSIERVLYARTAEDVRQRRSIWRPLVRYLVAINVVAIPIGLLLYAVADPLFAVLFGDKWTGCGDYVRLLLPWMVLSLSAQPLMFLSIVFSVQRVEFGFFLLLFALRVAGLAVGLANDSFILSIALYAAAGALVSVLLLVWYLVLVRRYERQRVRE